jgi:hypothetical protein
MLVHGYVQIMKLDDGTSDPHIGGSYDDAPEYVVSSWTPNGTSWSQAWEIVREADADEVLEWPEGRLLAATTPSGHGPSTSASTAD